MARRRSSFPQIAGGTACIERANVAHRPAGKMAGTFLELSFRALGSLKRFFEASGKTVGLWSNLSYSFGRTGGQRAPSSACAPGVCNALGSVHWADHPLRGPLLTPSKNPARVFRGRR